MMRMSRISVWLVTIVLAVVAVSCGKFAYHAAEHEESSVYVAVSDSHESDLPCHVMMTRLVNACHYVWDVDTASHRVRLGEYYAVAYRAAELYDITSVNEFKADPAVSMQDVYAVLPSDYENYGKLADFNPYSSFIRQADEHLECDFKKVSVADTSMVVVFNPEPMTQSITFRLRVRTGAGVTIERLTAAISGVPSKVRLMSGMVRNDAENPTYRQYIDMAKVGTSDTYEGRVSVLGLFSPFSSSHTSGPGIFQVMVQAKVTDGGLEFNKTFYAGINMKSAIEGAGLMEQAEDRSGYRIRRSSAVIDVPVVLDVRADSIFPGDGEGLEKWFENDEDITVEV